MATVLVLVFMLGLGIYIWGLLSPHKFTAVTNHSFSRASLSRLFIPVLLALFLGIGLTAPPEATRQITTEKTNTKQLLQSEGKIKSATSAQPVTTAKLVEVAENIPYGQKVVEDPSLMKDTKTVATQGVNGTIIKAYRVTYEDGLEITRVLESETISVAPIEEVVRVGTKVVATTPAPARQQTAGNCNPNYSGCVPNASDVDCAGGSGNGPAYISGPLTVTGNDVYGLDRDNDGIACE